VQAVRRWLDQPKNDRWLVIYDNYDNPALGGNLYGSPSEQPDSGDEDDGDESAVSRRYDIRPFLPDIHHGAILITTRSSDVKIGRRIALRKLKNIQDSLEILAYTSNRRDVHEGMYYS
jgi:hypothetical protein